MFSRQLYLSRLLSPHTRCQLSPNYLPFPMPSFLPSCPIFLRHQGSVGCLEKKAKENNHKRQPVDTYTWKVQESVNPHTGTQRLKMWISRSHPWRCQFRKSGLGPSNLHFNNVPQVILTQIVISHILERLGFSSCIQDKADKAKNA